MVVTSVIPIEQHQSHPVTVSMFQRCRVSLLHVPVFHTVSFVTVSHPRFVNSYTFVCMCTDDIPHVLWRSCRQADPYLP